MDYSELTKEELEKKIDELETEMFLEQMKDYMDHFWYKQARDTLKKMKDALNEKE